MKILIVPNWALPFGEGITLYKLILVRKNAVNIPYTVSHEVCHVEQIERLGFWKWLYQYTKELIAVGYRNNRFEVEARLYGQRFAYKYRQYEKET